MLLLQGKKNKTKQKTIPGHGIIKMDTFLLFAILMKSKFKSSIAKSNNKQKTVINSKVH